MCDWRKEGTKASRKKGKEKDANDVQATLGMEKMAVEAFLEHRQKQ